MRHPAAAAAAVAAGRQAGGGGCLNIQGLIAGRSTKSSRQESDSAPHKERAMIKYAYACQVESGKLPGRQQQPSPMWMNPS